MLLVAEVIGDLTFQGRGPEDEAALLGREESHTDCGLLARYLMTVANGIAVQAAGGAPRDELQQVADMALRSWPPA